MSAVHPAANGNTNGTSMLHAVALGGGHGLAATLSALRLITPNITAVVTVADDGGSSGRLRRELGVLPPGDLRQALAALCGRDELGTLWRDTMQHRFAAEGHLQGHALGNLILLALLEQANGDPVAALDTAGKLLGIAGRVLPMCADPLVIGAYISGLDEANPELLSIIRGQVAITEVAGTVEHIFLEPGSPPACPDAVKAVDEADVAVLGPGSWYSSVLPHLMVPELLEAWCRTPAKKIVALNLVGQVGETEHFRPETHLEVLHAHAPEFRADVVIADPATVTDQNGLRQAAQVLGAYVEFRNVAILDGPQAGMVHDTARFSNAFRDLLAL